MAKNLVMIHPARPSAAIEIWTGNAVFISFCTPESEVNVEDPVKFIAINEDIAPIIRYQEITSETLLPSM